LFVGNIRTLFIGVYMKVFVLPLIFVAMTYAPRSMAITCDVLKTRKAVALVGAQKLKEVRRKKARERAQQIAEVNANPIPRFIFERLSPQLFTGRIQTTNFSDISHRYFERPLMVEVFAREIAEFRHEYLFEANAIGLDSWAHFLLMFEPLRYSTTQAEGSILADAALDLAADFARTGDSRMKNVFAEAIRNYIATLDRADAPNAKPENLLPFPTTREFRELVRRGYIEALRRVTF
jgi:hypothetical protein